MRRGALVVLLAVTSQRARAQEPLIERLTLDKLQLTSLGVAYGRIIPSQTEATGLYMVTADYGELLPNWRVIFGVSYWESRYRDEVVRAFVDSLNKNLDNPSGDAQVLPSTISLYDVTFSAETRYTPPGSAAMKPFIGLGIATHVVNADGKLINGTLVERAIDNIQPGLFLNGGISLKIEKHLGFEAVVRGDLVSSLRSMQLRAGGSYYFGHVRAPRPTGDGK